MVYMWHPGVIAEFSEKSWVLRHAGRGIFYRAEGGIAAVLAQMPFESLEHALSAVSVIRSWAPAQVASVKETWDRLIAEGLIALQVGPSLSSSCVWSAELGRTGWSALGRYAEGQDWLGEDLYFGEGTEAMQDDDELMGI